MPNNKDLFTLLGLQDLPEERKAQLTAKMGLLVQKDVMMRVLDELSDVEQDELEKLIEQHPDDLEKMYAFVEGKVPDIDEIVKESIESLRGELMAIVGK